MRLVTALLLVAIVMMGAGCARMYTSIDRNDDGSYTVTQNNVGFLRIYGRVYRCVELDRKLSCRLIDTQ